MGFFGFGEKKFTPPGAEKFVAKQPAKAPELSVRRSEGGLDKAPKPTPKSVLAERYHQAREMPASVRAKVFGAPESMNARLDETEEVTEEEMANAVDDVIGENTLKSNVTTMRTRRESAQEEQQPEGRAFVHAGEVHDSSQLNTAKDYAKKLEEEGPTVDMSNAIDVDFRPDENDESFEIDRGPQLKKTGTR